jgi:hypothetical protein
MKTHRESPISVSRGKGPGRYESSSIMAIKHIPMLVGGLEHGFYDFPMTFHSVGNGIIIPTDVHIFQRD